MRIAFVVDQLGREFVKGVVRPGRTIRVIEYIYKYIGLSGPVLIVPAHPDGQAHTAKELRENAEWVRGEVAKFKPDAVVFMGRNATYPFSADFPQNVRNYRRFEKLWGLQFDVLGYKATCTLPPSMLFAKKGARGGYIYLRTLVENVAGLRDNTPEQVGDYRLVDDRATLRTILQRTDVGLVGLDLETTGLNPLTESIRTIQFSFSDRTGITVPFSLLTVDEWRSAIDWLTERGMAYALQNGKFDSRFLRVAGIKIPAWHELSAMHVIMDEREGTHNLDFIARQILGEGKVPISQQTLLNGTIEEIAEYAARDADITRRCVQALLPTVEDRTAYRILRGATATLANAEFVGIKIDQEHLDDLTRRCDMALLNIGSELAELGVIPSSVANVADYFDLDGSTAKDVLEELDDPVARKVVEYRGLVKVNNTYLRRIKAASAFDGRFHPDYRMAGPETGRLSSGSGHVPPEEFWKPINIMNIPRPAEPGQVFKYESERLRSELRSLFVADPGHVIVGADLEAAEVRVAASLSGDSTFIEHMNKRYDIHAMLCVQARGLSVPFDPYTHPQEFKAYVSEHYKFFRTAQKRGTFAILYGGGLEAIMEQAGCDRPTAKLIYDVVFDTYPGFGGWTRDVHSTIQKTGKLTTLFGRQRVFPYSTGVFPANVQSEMLREGQNYLIQSTASDACLWGMSNFYHENPQWPILIFNHDANYTQCRIEDAEECAARLTWHMENAYPFAAKLYAEAHYGSNWGVL